MTQALEAGMLICFGVSWPISVAKNIRARSAKAMSLKFILLIIFGYIAGIAAKLISGNITYVLAVYIFNLVVVSINLAVYFRNARLDHTETTADTVDERSAEEICAEAEEKMKEVSLSESTIARIAKYEESNSFAVKGGTVFFGSTVLAGLPTDELRTYYGLDEIMYNRSISGLTIDEASGVIDTCAVQLDPSKIFVCIGEEDVQDKKYRESDFLSKYEWLLYNLHCKTNATLYILSVCSNTGSVSGLNKQLKKLSDKYGAEFIDITGAENSAQHDLKIFSRLAHHIRSGNITFSEAMSM